ncbi:hypothetical protein [Coleofasciculus sp. G2-EDA-02]
MNKSTETHSQDLRTTSNRGLTFTNLALKGTRIDQASLDNVSGE